MGYIYFLNVVRKMYIERCKSCDSPNKFTRLLVDI